jgi:hypothetical protein
LKRLGQLKGRNLAIAIGTLALLIIPAIGSVYPVPPPPTNYYPYIFLAYFLIGVLLLWNRSGRIQDDAVIGEPA